MLAIAALPSAVYQVYPLPLRWYAAIMPLQRVIPFGCFSTVIYKVLDQLNHSHFYLLGAPFVWLMFLGNG